MAAKARNAWRRKHIDMLKPFMNKWKNTNQLHSILYDLVGTARLPSKAELGGTLRGDKRIDQTVPHPTEQTKWRWKDGS